MTSKHPTPWHYQVYDQHVGLVDDNGHTIGSIAAIYDLTKTGKFQFDKNGQRKLDWNAMKKIAWRIVNAVNREEK